MSRPFRFKQFEIIQERTPMKVGTDGVLLGAWAEGGNRILDVGTGTGLVALMMAQRFPGAEVVGVDICDEAVEEARYNVLQSPFSDRVRIEKKDFRNMEDAVGFDAIVCNPPYFEHSLKCPSEGRTMARHSDSLGLDELLVGAKGLLREKGSMSVVLPYTAYGDIILKARENGLVPTRVMRVRGTETAEWKRVLISFSMEADVEPKIEDLTLEIARGKRSPGYTQLTRDFYL